MYTGSFRTSQSKQARFGNDTAMSPYLSIQLGMKLHVCMQQCLRNTAAERTETTCDNVTTDFRKTGGLLVKPTNFQLSAAFFGLTFFRAPGHRRNHRTERAW